MHEGMDFTAKIGTPIYATGDGIVAQADNRALVMGIISLLGTVMDNETLYGHLSKHNSKK
jgi:murein DD-endopeptidase MepM/ murein hydrolase activator NlpD